jgi:hypothetical protein
LTEWHKMAEKGWRTVANRDPHPGIRIDKIPIKGWAGLIFVLGVMLLFLIGSPAVRWFFLLSIPPGVLIGVALYLIHRHRP